jgi:2,4-dienoyl-CoA reductase-like NADH-dependent reductase (Old Yellow Enzyme family)
MTIDIASPLVLPCGVTLKNRLIKAPMTEGLADGWNRATIRHERLYRRWAEGGAAVLITGNVQVDRRYLERPGNVAIDDNGGLDALKAYARAGTVDNTQLWMQISHSGRQTPRRVNPQPVAPSAVPLNLPETAFGHPRALDGAEVADVVRRFAHVATVARETGFSGVQVHGAHGYLISEFLSPLANRRTDEWGGSLENRARLLLETVRAVRRAVGADFPISVKLNSSDFQHGGFSHEECLQVVRWLDEAGVDLLEISGGNYEQPSMMGVLSKESGEPVRASTAAREAYFIDYGKSVRGVTGRMPLMVTGGFRSRAAMDAALAEGALDAIGIGRPMCVDADLPRQLLDGRVAVGESYERGIRPAKAGLGWFCLQIIRMGDGLDPDPSLQGDRAIAEYLANEEATAARLTGRTISA